MGTAVGGSSEDPNDGRNNPEQPRGEKSAHERNSEISELQKLKDAIEERGEKISKWSGNESRRETATQTREHSIKLTAERNVEIEKIIQDTGPRERLEVQVANQRRGVFEHFESFTSLKNKRMFIHNSPRSEIVPHVAQTNSNSNSSPTQHIVGGLKRLFLKKDGDNGNTSTNLNPDLNHTVDDVSTPQPSPNRNLKRLDDLLSSMKDKQNKLDKQHAETIKNMKETAQAQADATAHLPEVIEAVHEQHVAENATIQALQGNGQLTQLYNWVINHPIQAASLGVISFGLAYVIWSYIPRPRGSTPAITGNIPTTVGVTPTNFLPLPSSGGTSLGPANAPTIINIQNNTGGSSPSLVEYLIQIFSASRAASAVSDIVKDLGKKK